jgi:hypothetical protein
MRDLASGIDKSPGFGIGTIRLEMPKTRYTAGNAIEGTLLLSVSRPVMARGLFAILSAQQQFSKQPGLRENGLHVVPRKVYHYQQQLDGEREYQKTAEPAAYPFRLKLPPIAGFMQDTPDPASGSAAVTGSVGSSDGSVPFGPPEWSVEGFLDLPLAFGVRETVRLSVRKRGRDEQGP